MRRTDMETRKGIAYYRDIDDFVNAIYDAYNTPNNEHIYLYAGRDGDNHFFLADIRDKLPPFEDIVSLGDNTSRTLYDMLTKVDDVDMEDERLWGDNADPVMVKGLKAFIYEDVCYFLNVQQEG
jgi:hypothetical protein